MFKSFITDLYEYEDKGVLSNPLLFNLGLIHYKAISTYFSISNSVKFIRKNHLFGDPELPIWTREPVDLTVSTSPATITNQNGQLTVSVSGMAYSEYATNDVMVCVMKDEEVYLREPYNGSAHSHDFVFDIHPETAGTLKVTVTGHNYIPYETTVPVSITGKNVYVTQKAVQDAAGNNDGKLDAGETVHLGISLKNNGTVNLTNVHATLSCQFVDTTMNQNLSSYLTLTTASASYGTIAKNATVTRNNYQFTLSDTVPDRSALQCTLTVYDGTGQINTRSFVLPVGAPDMEYVSVRYEEKGNGRIGLEIELTNTGFGTAKGITATLASQDVQVSAGTATYGTVSHLESKTRSFEFIPAGSFNGSSFLLTVTDAYGKTWPFGFDLNILLDTVANLAFENTEHSIKLRWDPVTGSNGYNVYRSMTLDGDYERLNNHPFTSSAYPDLGMEELQTYYYGVTYLDDSGNESPMARIAAWTSLPLAAGWPVSVSDTLGRIWGTAPNVTDVDGDRKQEVFLTSGSGDIAEAYGAVLAFNHLGEELYDIDHNPTTVSGFANLGVSMTCTPAIGDIDGDGIMEVVVATRDNLNNDHKLHVYKNRDADNDGIPDLAWEHSLDRKNFNGVVLADLDNDGTLEIIAPNQGRDSQYGHTYLEVFNASGEYYYPKNSIRVADQRNHDGKAVTMPVVTDLDNDGYKEIVFGLEGGVYSWNCRQERLDTLVPYSQTDNERTDCPVVAADIDGDGTLEVLYMAILDKKGYVKAVEADSTPVSAWSGNTHGITLTGDDHDYEWPPYFCVADLDNDGGIEVFAADRDTLRMWNGDGTPFGAGTVVVNGLDCRYMQPLVADVDGGGDCEIVVPSQDGKIHAFKPDGSAVPGWPLAVADLSTIPVITDLDGDGLNEVVAASKTEVYVWHTVGESRYNGWDRFRYDRCNNAVYELPCTHSGTPLGISDTLVWTEDRRLNRDVIVNGGALLTVKSKLEFSGGSKVVVRPGGRLVVDGGRLTGSCPDAMWKGIEVWGDSTAHQQQVDGRYLQGYLELREGAVIENALCAVELQDPLDDATTGGVVHATGALFRNNAMAVHAGPYRCLDAVSGAELAYNAWFRDCTFSTGAGYLADTVFHSHALLEGVRGVAFSGCAFSADRDVPGVSSLCYGIDAYDASLLVNTYCDALIRPCPAEDLVRSSFSGFHQGIHAVGDGQREAIPMVYDADFSGNDIGVLCRATGFATLVGNSFTLGNDADCAIGLYADGVTGLIAEDNAFQASPYPDVITYGAVVEDSRAANDVYLNSFSGLDYGNLSIGQNAVIDYSGGTPSATSGLTYTCNTNADNRVDFYIADKTGEYSGIQPAQGSARTPAGNTFGGSQYHIYNGGDYQLQYFHNSLATGQTPSSSKLHGVTATGVLRDHPCASHYGGQPRGGSPEELAALEAVFVEADSSYAALRRIYESRLDGGDTRAATAAVVAAHADDAPALKARLMALSPYLSQQVLLAAARRSDILSPGDLFDVLWANPDELGRDTLVRQIEGLGVLEDGMAELLRGRAGAFTERTALEAETASAAHGRTLALGDMARCLLSDTAVDNVAVRGLLLRFGAPDTDRLAVTSLMEEGDTEGALALAGTLPDRYGLEGADLEEHGDYMRLLGLYCDLRRTGRTVGELTPEELSMAEKIAGQGRGASRTMAETLLERGFGGHNASFCPPEYATVNRDGTEGKGTGTDAAPKGRGASDGMTVTVSPSPATATATVAYTLPGKVAHATLELANTLGVKVLSAELNGNSGSMTLDLGRLAGGVYYYTVRCGELVETGKLVVVK